MTVLPVLLALHTALIGVPLDLKLEADLQLRGGYSQTPFITGPDSAPLLNVGGTGAGAPEFNTIVTPAVALTLKQANFLFSIGYQPRLFFDLLAATAPSVFHGVNLAMTLGRSADWLLTVGANASVGGLNFGQAGQALNEFSGSLRPGTTSSALDFLSLAAYARVEHPLNADWKLSSIQTVSKISTPPASSSNFVAGSVAALTVGGVALPPLQNEVRLDSAYEATYRLNSFHAFRLDFLGTVASFQATATYLSLSPGVGWDGQVGKYDKLGLKAGVLKYWANPHPGRYLRPQYLITGGIAYEHSFASIDLPRLVGSLEITEQPYYDIIYGDIEPRGTVSAGLTYEVSRELKLRAQVRSYTQEYFTGTHFLPVPKQHDKYVLVGSTEVNYQYAKYLAFRGGLFGLDRSIVPSSTVPYTHVKEFYAYVSVKGTYDVD
jgi:hypothetical protein